MIIENTQVYGVEETLRASGYPKMTPHSSATKSKSWNRVKTLGSAPVGSGHDCCLKGIVVQTDITAPQYWWLQMMRYSFFDIVSSQSKMHKITEMSLVEQSSELVRDDILDLLQEVIADYNDGKVSYDAVMSNVPMGLMLKKNIVTNYLQLKTIYFQRKTHRLEEWETFIEWLEQLPQFLEIITKEGK